jgi:hypothetical protein
MDRFDRVKQLNTDADYPNRDDWNEGFYKNNYIVYVGFTGHPFAVNADNEQDALDFVIDHCEESGYLGLVATHDELVDDGMSDDEIAEYYCGGNHSLYLTANNIRIETV